MNPRPLDPKTPPPDAAALDAAWEAVRAHLPHTPLVPLAEGCLGKAEYALPTGAFKVRGAVAALTALADAGVREVVAASAGNHGQGVAWAAQRLGVRATVVVPRDCPAVKLDAMRARCDVVVHDQPGYDAAEARGIALAHERGAPFVSPFDDARVMAGNGGTLAREIIAERPDVRTIVVPVGGGGLLSGIVSELRRAGHGARVVPVQSQACPSFARSVAERAWYATWPPAETLAEGLEGGAGATSVAIALRDGLEPVLVAESDIADAMLDLCAMLDTPIEGSAAVGWAAWRAGLLDVGPGPVVIVLTGGNVSRATLDALRAPNARR